MAPIKSKLKPDHKGRNTFRTPTFVIHRPLSPQPHLLSSLPFSVPFPRSAVTRFIKIKGIQSAKSPGSNGSAGLAKRGDKSDANRSTVLSAIRSLLTNREDSQASAPWGIEGKALGRITRAKRFCRRQRHGVPISLAAQIRRTFLPARFRTERGGSQGGRKRVEPSSMGSIFEVPQLRERNSRRGGRPIFTDVLG
ncbi:hypothetical protein K0M31_002964 [Melipona bicolor]|uniref:Uncharacterized protein n=1 Tax=Melipona bicolor TaxID=60889 RepID=A0AA40KQ02_9HYME|nr:hypothetical protein K0M31_002964 [Melipona bicolor]